MSAAAVITPMLVTFLHIEPYTAVGIALASDVLASAVSAYTYGRNRNLDIRNGLIMMITVLAFTVVGSLVSSLVPSVAMGNFSVIMTLLLGIKFIVRPVMTTKEDMQQIQKRTRIIKSILCGAIVGFICGFIGAGGGMMMLLLLTGVMGYELKTAVGTSVFIMTFTADRLRFALRHRRRAAVAAVFPVHHLYVRLCPAGCTHRQPCQRQNTQPRHGRYSRHSRRRDPGLFAAGIVVYKNNTAIGSRCYFLITRSDIAISERFSSWQMAGKIANVGIDNPACPGGEIAPQTLFFPILPFSREIWYDKL